jgi:hypothetical protein
VHESSFAIAPHRSSRRKTALLLVATVALLIAGPVYYRVGWYGMESACTTSDALGQTHESVAFSWTWHPLGFTCTYDDGSSQTSLWP